MTLVNRRIKHYGIENFNSVNNYIYQQGFMSYYIRMKRGLGAFSSDLFNLIRHPFRCCYCNIILHPQGLIQKENVDIDGEKSAQISTVAKKTVIQR